MATYVCTDPHGGAKGFKQLLERAKFDKETDRLILLGDICDGWPQVKELIDELLTIKNLIYLIGNHDQWAIDFYTGKMKLPDYLSNRDIEEERVYFKRNDSSEFELWYTQGGKATLDSLGVVCKEKYLTFLQKAQPYHYENNIMFCHAGFDFTENRLEDQTMYYLIWDRHLIKQSYINHIGGVEGFKSQWVSEFYHGLKEIYVGHTPTILMNEEFTTPQKWCKLWAMDTGATFTGKLSMMNIETKEVFQSDELMKLYPNHKGRNKLSYNELNKLK